MHESSANAHELQLKTGAKRSRRRGGARAEVRCPAAFPGGLLCLMSPLRWQHGVLGAFGFLFVQLEEAATHLVPDGLNLKSHSRPVNSNGQPPRFRPTNARLNLGILD